jgi:hypothetical protein
MGVILNHTVLLTIAETGLLGLYGLYSEQWRQRIRLPFLQWKFNRNAERRHLVQNCKTDYFFLKQSMKNWITSW